MISLTVYGLDQFVVGKLSREMTSALADLYECDREEILFIAPENMIFHNGVEQTSWNALVKVDAPKKVSVLQEDAARLIMNMVKGPTIHVQVVFNYFSQDNFYENLNDDYPRYIENENLVNFDEDYDENIEEGEGDDQIFTGDIFKDFNK
ncbi:MAG: DUF1904 family protein [Bacilli bacterium]|nr:DUF1904 family protein [Bacilli bacterium]MBO4682810.1 DUF1904 family protein [Bacilli bacterium]